MNPIRACAVAAAMAGLFVSAQSAAETATVAAAGAPAATGKVQNPNEMVCEKQDATGSRLAKRRVCMTRAQWADINSRSAEIEKVQNQSGIRTRGQLQRALQRVLDHLRACDRASSRLGSRCTRRRETQRKPKERFLPHERIGEITLTGRRLAVRKVCATRLPWDDGCGWTGRRATRHRVGNAPCSHQYPKRSS